jgi:predicted Fe-Mo cluster-binding NifX family protein
VKICISSIGREKESLVDHRFGRCAYFFIGDTETGDFKFVENAGIQSAHGAGIAAAQQVLDEKVNVVITGNMGPNAMKLIASANIDIYRCEDGEVKEQINLLKGNKLEKITKAVPAHSGMGN